MQDSLAPIVLFVYNRPLHTRKCLESLAINKLANESELYIYSDGPKEHASEEDVLQITQVRQVIREKKWCKIVHLVELKKNKGVSEAVKSGITEVVQKHGKVIVLEDDILVSKSFLQYMNESLNLYGNDKKVAGISAYTYPNTEKNLPETYFLHMGCSWGWATWQRAWNHFSFNVPELISKIKATGHIKKFDVGGYPYFEMLKSQDKAEPDAWDIQCYASLFLSNSMFLFPKKSLSRNIGFDNSGTHRSPDRYFDVELTDFIEVKRIEATESKFARRGIEKSFQKWHTPTAIDKIASTLKKIKKVLTI